MTEIITAAKAVLHAVITLVEVIITTIVAAVRALVA